VARATGADVPPAVLALHARFERPVPPPAPTARDSAALEAALPADALHEPLADYFRRFSDNEVIVRRVTRAVIRYSQERDLAPSLVAAVLVTENRTLTPRAASPVGAQGLMQVMPFHAGMRGCPSSDLTNVENNICHGTGILARDLGRTANTRKALLRYNGCVKGTNTPDCYAYPAQVLRRAGRIRREILTSATMAWAPVPAIAHDGQLLAVSTR
jgi:soluble lytic murein transglycosylase-like protein